MPIKQQGFSLIDIFLSIGLGAFIMSSAYILFSSEQKTYAGQQAIVQLQEVGRIATTLLRDRLRQAGGLGCSTWNTQLPFYQQTQTLPDWLPTQANEIISGHHAEKQTWSPVLPHYLAGRVRENTDVLIIHHAYEQSADLMYDMPQPHSPLMVTNNVNLKIGDILMIADCQQADMFKISHLAAQDDQWQIEHHSPDNISSHLSKAYSRSAQISVLQNAAYYIGDTKRRYESGEPVYALYQFNGEHQELLEGVNGLRVWYGVDSNHDSSVDTILELPPTANQGKLRSVLIEIDTQSQQYHQQTWYLTAAFRH